MLAFILRRLGTMLLTMLCLTLVVFFLVNLEPNLKKLAISQTEHARLRRAARELAGQERLPAELLRPLRPVARRRAEAAQHRPRDRQGDAALLASATSPTSRPSPASCRAISAARPSSRRTVADKAVPGARRHRHPDVLGDGDDGADRAADRHPGRHARGHRAPTARCRSPRSPRPRRPNMSRASSSPSSSPPGSAGSTARRRRRRRRASPSTISPCR